MIKFNLYPLKHQLVKKVNFQYRPYYMDFDVKKWFEIGIKLGIIKRKNNDEI
jgi:hypothetical protein